MFPTSSSSDSFSYDFFSEENLPKWKGIFLQTLNVVHHQTHPSLSAKEDALEYIETLILQLLATLCACEPHTVPDVEERVQKTFPDPIDKWAIRDAQGAIEKVDNRNKKHSPLVLPVEKIHHLLVKEVLGYRIDLTVAVYIVAVLEYIAADILKLTGNYVKNIKHSEITSQDIKVAICADQVLMDMFSQEEEVSLPLVEEPTRQESLSYEGIVKDFILEENQFMRDLNMIIKVFRIPFVKHFPRSKDLEVIFSNITDVYTFTANLLASVEEQVEIAAENEAPTVGICFQDMAEDMAFNCYEKYVEDMLAPRGKERLHTLLQREDISKTLMEDGHGFKDAMKYVLPKLLLGPIHHCLHYFEVLKCAANANIGHGIRDDVRKHITLVAKKHIKVGKIKNSQQISSLEYFKPSAEELHGTNAAALFALINCSASEEDRDCLEQADGLLTALKVMLEKKITGSFLKKKPWEISLRLQGRTGRQAVVQKMYELQKSIDGWEGKDIWQSCSEFIIGKVADKLVGEFLKYQVGILPDIVLHAELICKDGVLNKHMKGKTTERHVFLFDSLIILCKPNMRRASVTGPQGEYKLKEKFYLRKVEIRDKDDIEDYKHAFEIQAKDHPNNSIILVAKSAEEKSNWMAALITLQTRSMLERRLDAVLKEEEKQTPLRLPPPEHYRFAIEDSEENIVFEENQQSSVESPLIKGGTLLKLVERLTYHMYADPKFVRTFLTTYRSFCSPQNLLDLLIERFEIHEPLVDQPIEEEGQNDTLMIRDDIKRFRKEYVKPVQFRVVNVLRHWVDHHFYDFERDQGLLHKLKEFLDTVKGKAMRKMADSILNVIQRRTECPGSEREFTYQKPPPPIETHLARQKEYFDVLTLHPIEIARQITLLEFDLYRAVQPSELVGSVWMKADKYKTSPNLLKMIEFSNMFTFWLEKCIIEAENLEERVAIVCRCIEIMTVCQELNNFNAVLEIVSALNSAPVHRLEHTFSEVPHRFMKVLNEAKELNSDHFKKYTEKLRSINPPCVPFLGMYLTNIIYIEEGNPDFLPRRTEGLINFSKRRKIAENTGEIQQYQNQPYCLTVDSDIRDFLENLRPLEEFKDEKEFNDYLYAKSLEIEPRGCKQPPKFARKTQYSLKSPGTKPMSRHSAITSRSHTFTFSSFAGGYTRMEEDQDGSSLNNCTTPPTPTTPISPSATSLASDAVFASVNIGQGNLSTNTSNVPTGDLISIVSSIGEEESVGQLQPPPLPPRRRNRDSTNSDVFMRSSSPLPPQLPPRTDQPPPVPPRRESSHSTFHTLPRPHSVSHPSPSQTLTQSRSVVQSYTESMLFGGTSHNFSATLPRFGDRDSTHITNIFNSNGANEEIPQLPPRTYRSQHSRKKSS